MIELYDDHYSELLFLMVDVFKGSYCPDSVL